MLVELDLERIAVVLDQSGQGFTVLLHRTADADMLAPLISTRLSNVHPGTITTYAAHVELREQLNRQHAGTRATARTSPT